MWALSNKDTGELYSLTFAPASHITHPGMIVTTDTKMAVLHSTETPNAILLADRICKLEFDHHVKRNLAFVTK